MPLFSERDVSDERLAAFGLLLPALLCGGMGAAFVQAVPSSKELNGALQKLKLEGLGKRYRSKERQRIRLHHLILELLHRHLDSHGATFS